MLMETKYMYMEWICSRSHSGRTLSIHVLPVCHIHRIGQNNV